MRRNQKAAKPDINPPLQFVAFAMAMNAVLLENRSNIALEGEGTCCAGVNGTCSQGAAVLMGQEGSTQKRSREDGIFTETSHRGGGARKGGIGGTREYAVYWPRVKRSVGWLWINSRAAGSEKRRCFLF